MKMMASIAVGEPSHPEPDPPPPSSSSSFLPKFSLLSQFQSPKRDTKGILAVAVSSSFWVSYTSGQVSIFSPNTLSELYALTIPLNERAYCLLPHKGLIILISEFGKIALWKEDTRKLLGFYRIPHNAIVKSAVIIGDHLHTADANGVILVRSFPFFFPFPVIEWPLLVAFFSPLSSSGVEHLHHELCFQKIAGWPRALHECFSEDVVVWWVGLCFCCASW